jgi:hypothetical protein
MISVGSRGSFQRTIAWAKRLDNGGAFRQLEAHGRRGVQALQKATPVDTGETAASWDYRIIRTPTQARIEWFNTNESNGVSIAIIRQYGHGTGTGGWVEGIDYINPALKPIFDQIANDVWKEVIR